MNKAEIRKLVVMAGYIAKSARRVAGFNKSILQQLQEAIRMRFRNGLGLSEYYDFRLWDDKRYTEEQKLDYVGWRWESKIDELGNDREYFGLVNDKFIFQALMAHFGIACPEIYGIFSIKSRNYGNMKVISSREDLRRFIIEEIKTPFFSKPNDFTGGRGAMGIRSVKKHSSKIVLINGTEMGLEDYLGFVSEFGRDFMFQECLETATDLIKKCGSMVTSLRIISLVDGVDARVFRVLWKMPLGGNMNDNFQRGKAGNMVAMVNRETGKVERVIFGSGFEQREVTTHPETKEMLLGITIPYYEDACKLVLRGSMLLPRLRIQNWDIALTKRGPIALEANIYGCNFLAQVAGPPGFRDKELRTFLIGMKK